MAANFNSLNLVFFVELELELERQESLNSYLNSISKKVDRVLNLSESGQKLLELSLNSIKISELELNLAKL